MKMPKQNRSPKVPQSKIKGDGILRPCLGPCGEMIESTKDHRICPKCSARIDNMHLPRSMTEVTKPNDFY